MNTFRFVAISLIFKITESNEASGFIGLQSEAAEIEIRKISTRPL